MRAEKIRNVLSRVDKREEYSVENICVDDIISRLTYASQFMAKLEVTNNFSAAKNAAREMRGLEDMMILMKKRVNNIRTECATANGRRHRSTKNPGNPDFKKKEY